MLAPSVSALLVLTGTAEAVAFQSHTLAVEAAQEEARQRAADQAEEEHQEAEERAQERAERRAERERRRSSRPAVQAPAPAPAGSPRDIARALVPAGQFGCLNALWTRESNWNPSATNPSSGAYGIPQALPASKMSSAGADWRTNPATQIRWGLSYIAGRYGSPCGAWAHSQAHGWY